MDGEIRSFGHRDGGQPLERRRGVRASIDLPAVVIAGGRRHACRAAWVSTSGLLLLRADENAGAVPAPPTPLVVHLWTGAGPIRLAAETVWDDGAIRAVRFVEMTDADRLTLAELVDRAVRAA